MRDLWTTKRGHQAHHKRHHDTPSGRTTPGRGPQVVVVRGPRAVVRVIVEPMADGFRLYDGRTTQFLGAYGSRPAAWAAADEHLPRRLAAGRDWVVGEYLVVGRRAAGSLDVESQITHLGPADDPEACRRWLRSLPGRD